MERYDTFAQFARQMPTIPYFSTRKYRKGRTSSIPDAQQRKWGVRVIVMLKYGKVYAVSEAGYGRYMYLPLLPSGGKWCAHF